MQTIDISFKRIQQLALPAIIAGIAEPVLSSTDAAIVGNISEFGTESLAAVGIVGVLLSTLIWVLAQTRSAISAIISQNLGAGKVDTLQSFPVQAILFNVLLSIVVLFSTYFFIEEILIFLNAEDLILKFSLDYYNIRVWGFPLTLFTFAIFGIFRGFQNTFWPMIVAAIGAITNIVLDFAFVYGVDGFIEPMHVKGAAWASLISQAIMAIMALIFLLKKTEVSLKLKRKIHPEIKRLVAMSFNLFIRSVALNVALLIAVREATSFGKEFIAAHTIAINLWLFSAFFLDGYGAAGNILGGRLLGAKNYKKLWKLTKKVNGYNLIVSVLLIIVGLLFYKQLGLLFNKDALVLSTFYSVFMLVLISQPFNALAFTFDAIFKGLGEMKYLRNILLASTFLGFIPTLLICTYFDLKLTGIWIALVVWVAFRALVLIIKFKNKYYKLAQK
ncbi:MAG: MATE family multidrug resistance protein [Flavobacteriaceae bacterium]|jgi:MATE family multidrug resistance protein